MKEYRYVFSPLKFGNIEVKNRIEAPPMISCLATPDGYVTPELIELYRSIAKGGAGIVTVGDTAIDAEYARGHFSQMHLGDDGVITGLYALVEAIQRYGAVASIEINHSGRLVSQKLLNGKKPIGPSPIVSPREELVARMEGRKVVPVQEMDQDMIDSVIEGFANACQRCVSAGFEMVMIHGGHGQLISQFASPSSNKRKDNYGGSLENRARFAVEVLTAIRKKTGDSLTIEYRISADELAADGMHLEETIEFIKIIEDKIDLLHASLGGVSDRRYTPYMSQPTYLPYEFNVHRAEKIKKAINLPVTCVGSIIDLSMADSIIKEGRADIVAMGRAQIADPEIVNKTFQGMSEDIRPCLRCGNCGSTASAFYPIRCVVNPVIGRGLEYKKIPPAEKEKNVVIVGGGPAGMEAALIACSRGHKVTLLEKEAELGGALTAAAGPSFKPDMKRYLEWLTRKTKESSATIKFATTADAATIKEHNPDVLIIAVGAESAVPEIPGIKNNNVVLAADVDTDKAATGKEVIVAGAGLTGCETALHVAQKGGKVTVIDMISENEIAKDTNLPNKIILMDLMEKNNIKIIPEVKLEEVTNKGITIIDKQWQRQEIDADTVVLALGVKPRSEFVKEFQGLASETFAIGDCLRPRNLMGAIHDAFNIAVEI